MSQRRQLPLLSATVKMVKITEWPLAAATSAAAASTFDSDWAVVAAASPEAGGNGFE